MVKSHTNGCNLRCPTCQNWEDTYASRGALKTPGQAALTLTMLREEFELNRITVSGGESTLNLHFPSCSKKAAWNV